MEDEEEINTNNIDGYQQRPRIDAGEGGLGMDETLTPVEQPEVVSNDNITEQCEFFSDPLPEFDDPVESLVNEASMVRAEMEIQVEDMLDPEMGDFSSPMCVDDVEAENGEGVGDDVGDTSALELVDSLIVTDKSRKDGELAAAEDVHVEVAAERIVVCGSSGVVAEGEVSRDDSQLAGLDLPDLSKDDEAGTEKEASSPLLEEGVEHAGSDGGIADNENLLEIQNVVGAQSSVKEGHYEEEGKQEGTEDTDLDTQTELVNEVQVEKNSSPQVDDLNDADSLMGPRDDDDGEVVAEDVPIGDTEVETETDGTEMADAGDGSGGGGKRKRGKISKVPARSPARKVTEEDVCFICFDGGELVLCDRRGCPKAYHPSCVNRDEAFFRAKGRWNCGWHLCSTCEKNAHYMCYTCTFSLCKACIKDAVILCVKGNKGFCETCMKTVMEIENKEQANKEGGVDYDDKSSWMYLFKDYWMDLKASLSLSVDDLAQARNPWKRSDVLVGKQELAEDVLDTIHDDGSGSDSSENLKVIKPKRRNSKKRAKTIAKEDDLPGSATKRGAEGTSGSGRTEWASKELLEFVSHMKNGDKSVLSQFDVQALLLEYIKTNKLRDPRKKSQIVCDARFQNIFAKPRVGHFEMLKLLESHFLVKDDSQIDDVQGTAVDAEVNQLEADGTNDAPVKGGKEKRRKTRRKSSERGRPSNLDDYAAIDVHNISLIYLRRKLFEDLLDDLEKSCDKVIGTFVRIRISGSNQKQDIYRLVQIAGTSRAAEPYKVGKKTTDIVLEILNLNKTEVVSIDTISNQEFTEDECKRLRQSIKCGLINCPTVGDVLDKAQELQEVRVKDWLDSETVRLSHLRDRASEKGRKKELRECVEKLQLLKTRDERQRRLEEIPEIHADPKMDPSYESEEADSETEDNKQEFFSRPRGSSFGRKGREPVSPRGGNFHSTDSYSGSRRNSFKNWDSNKFISSQEPSKSAEANQANLVGDYAENQVRDRDIQETTNMEKINVTTNTENVGHGSYGFTKSGSSSEVLHAFPSSGVVEDTTAVKVNESEKMWHYKDPSGKVQGPFSIVQLRKWNNTGYFPADLKIWKAAEKEDESLLLTDALAGRFHKKLSQTDTNMTSTRTVQSPHASSAHGERPYRSALQQGSEGEGEAPKFSAADGRGSEYSRNDQINLPSPTPKLSTPDASGGGQFSRASASVSVNQSGSKEHTTTMGGSPSPAPSSQIVSSFSPLQNSQTNATGESQGWGSGSAAQRQEVVANHLHSMPAVQQQQAGYNQWGGNIQSPGQNHIGNFANPGFPAMPQSEPWRPPVAVNQPNLSWGVSVPGANAYTAAPGPRPENANMFWNPMQGNPNMGWGAPGTTNMNWMAASVPGQVPGWVAAAPTANPVGMVNPGWVPQAGHPGTVLPGHQPPPVSGNPAWGPSPNGNPGSQVNVNPVWGPPVGNQGGVGNNQGPAPGNAIPSWSGPAGSWGNDNQQQQGGGNDFGNHGGRQWNRDSNGGGNGQRGNWGWCRYEKAGTCRKGKHCRNRHT